MCLIENKYALYEIGNIKNPQYAFLRRGSKAVCPMSQICGM